MKLTDIELGVIDYIHQEIAAKATVLTKFLIYTGSFLGERREINSSIPSYFAEYGLD